MQESILQTLVTAVLAGASEVLAVRSSGKVSGRYKDETEYVTVADERSDRAMRKILEQELPGMSLRLEESGGTESDHWVGADPLDGTNHFAAGGNLYAVQAHYVSDGVPEAGVVFQPELFLPISEEPRCVGRLAYASRNRGAFVERMVYAGGAFERSDRRRIHFVDAPEVSRYAACVAVSSKMTPAERERAQRVLSSGLVAVSMGAGSAGANAMMTILGGQHVYANFGAGDDLDLIPPQVIAMEAGLTVWGMDRRPPVWRTRKQPVIFAQSEAIAERFLSAAGL